MRHYYAGSPDRQRSAPPRTESQISTDVAYEALQRFIVSEEGLGSKCTEEERTPFAVGFECAAAIALGAPELLQWWLHQHIARGKRDVLTWASISGNDPAEEIAWFDAMIERTARVFAGCVAQTGAFERRQLFVSEDSPPSPREVP